VFDVYAVLMCSVFGLYERVYCVCCACCVRVVCGFDVCGLCVCFVWGLYMHNACLYSVCTCVSDVCLV